MKAPLSLTREQIRGTVNEDMPFGIPQIDLMNNDELKAYFLGRKEQAQMGLPGSPVQSDEAVIQRNLRGIRERTRRSLKWDVKYARRRSRPVPQPVVDFVK